MDYRPDREGVAQFLLHSPLVADVLRDAAERGAEFLAGIAPVDQGDYRDHISTELGLNDRGDRQASYVVVDVGHAAAQDFPHGRGGRPRRGASRPLARMVGFLEGSG